MVQNTNVNIRNISNKDITVVCYFYGFFQSPGLSHYPLLSWVNNDYQIIKNQNIDNDNCQRIATNFLSILNQNKLINNFDYFVMMPTKATTISSLKTIIKELTMIIKLKFNQEIKFIDNMFKVETYPKFWENKLNLTERKKAIANKITLKDEYRHLFDNKRIIIIDDVVSTGTSIANIAILLNNNNDNLQIKALCYGSVYQWEKIYC